MGVFVCFFNDTATTESYTYCHTLSLHDALPICAHAGLVAVRGPVRADGDRAGGAVQRRRRQWHAAGVCPGRALRGLAGGDVGAFAGRSEEHTSELQSLMRISYAVFCLKKKHTTLYHYDLQQQRYRRRTTN